ncbi:hypothetical protein AB7M63_003180 [Bradyrhizobium japonicum]
MPERLGAKSVLVLLGVLLASPHSAQAVDGNRIAYGAGMLTCGEWQKYRVTGDKSATAQLEAWLDGFLSGYNMGSDVEFIAPKPQSVAYYAWMDNYCAQNPLNRIAQAAIALKNELTARAKN